MCLTAIYAPKSLPQTSVAYKVFKRTKGKLRCSFRDYRCMRVGSTSVDRCSEMLRTQYNYYKGETEYKAGFHCFCDRADAKAFAKRYGEVVVRVEIDPRTVTAYGYQEDMWPQGGSVDVVVARRIRLIEITDDYSKKRGG